MNELGIYGDASMYNTGTSGVSTANSMQTGVKAGIATFLTTGNPIAAIGMTLFSFGLSEITKPRQRREWTVEERLLSELSKKYEAISARRANAIEIASKISGKPKEYYIGREGLAALRTPLGESGLTAIDIAEEKRKKEETGVYAPRGISGHPALTEENIAATQKIKKTKKAFKEDLRLYEETGSTSGEAPSPVTEKQSKSTTGIPAEELEMYSPGRYKKKK